MGQPRPVSRRSAPVRFARSRGTCCFQASTASTANSGSVCSHARIARATPCAMKNCADSAAQAISIEAARIDGAVQRTLMGEPVLSERDTGILLNDRVLFERGVMPRIVRPEMRAAAFPAGEGAAGDEQADDGLGLFEFAAGVLKPIRVANDTAVPPHELFDIAAH